MDLKNLLGKLDLIEGTMQSAAKNPTGPKFTGQWKGTDAGTPGKKLVGDSVEPEENILKDLSKGPKPKTREQELAEEFDAFLQALEEENLGVEQKRPGRKGARPGREYTSNDKPSKRYTTIKEDTLGDGNEANAVVSELLKLISDGHTEVAPDVIIAKVSAALGRPFMLKDLVATNNNSPELQHYIDSINPTKIKFSTDILTVKNQDPAKEKEKSQAGVANMAARAAGRSRLGEGVTSPAIKQAYQDIFKTEPQTPERRQAVNHYQSLRKQEMAKTKKNVKENAEHLNVGDEVKITGPVEYQGSIGVIADFGRDKRFVVVEIPGEGRYSFHSSDVEAYEDGFGDEPNDQEDGFGDEPIDQEDGFGDELDENEYEDDYEDEEDEGFFVAISSEEDGVFIGMVVKEDGKWRERRYKGNAPHNWGGTYMGYLTPQDVMSWINKDYSRYYEVEGPMSEDEANEYLDYMSEGRWFKTSYGWAGGRNERTGGTYKHPETIKAERAAKRAAKKDAEKAAAEKTQAVDEDWDTEELSPQELSARTTAAMASHDEATADYGSSHGFGQEFSKKSLKSALNRKYGILKALKDKSLPLAQRLKFKELLRDVESEIADFQVAESQGDPHKIIRNKLKDIERAKNPPVASNLADREKRAKEEYRKYVAKMKKKNPDYVPLYKIDEYGADQPQGTAAGQPSVGSTNDPQQAQKVAQATQTLKAATGSTVPTTNLAKAIDAASQGKAVDSTSMKALEPLMKDVATVASDPKLAGQFKSLANQINQTQQKQTQQKI